MEPPAAPKDEDDVRHRREEAERRARRKADKVNKSEAQKEKVRNRKEHAQRVLREQNKLYPNNNNNNNSSSSNNNQQQQQVKHRGSGKKKHHPLSKEEESAANNSAFAALFASRTGGFLMEFKFRNAPPRPPVGPCFVGLGLEGELQEKWTKYVPNNAVERHFSWKLHAEPDLGVPLAPSAMDWHNCYSVPKEQELPPEDEALLHWSGHLGDSAAEELQRRRDRARANAHSSHKIHSTHNNRNQKQKKDNKTIMDQSALLKLKKRKDSSRVLDESRQFWMKKTTYLDNDRTKRVHDFRSLAQTKKQTFTEIDAKLKDSNNKILDVQAISDSFKKTAQTDSMQHPTNKNLKPVWQFPLLPDVSAWGHSFTHVVLDQPPKQTQQIKTTTEQLEHALIANVNKIQTSNKMACDMLVPKNVTSYKISEPTNFDVAQVYDLDVLPLKEEDGPHVHFGLFVDSTQKVVTYHPITSRVHLSTGRPVSKKKRKIQHLVTKRALNAHDVADMELRMAEVDQDCANKLPNDENDLQPKVRTKQEDSQTQQEVQENGFFGDDSSSDDSDRGF